MTTIVPGAALTKKSDTTFLPDELDARRWMHDGACVDSPNPGAWFPEKYVRPTYALAVCARCPVREKCLAYALMCGANGQVLIGVWGGTTTSERRDILRRRRAA